MIKVSIRKGSKHALFLCLILVFYGEMRGQLLEAGLTVGLTNYQGDLPSSESDGGLQIKLHPEVGLFGRYSLTNFLMARGDLFYSRISGDDAISSVENTRRRNLHFRSPIIELSLGAELYPLHFFGQTPRLDPYVFLGIGVYHFNPQAEYEGDWVDLQPLSTEGQGLAQYPDQKEYSLWQFNVPVGVGARFQLNELISLSAEFLYFWNFTDYLDDVSTVYVPYPDLLAANGILSASLANRTGEYLGTEPVLTEPGASRGNPDLNDHFGSFRIAVGYNITGAESVGGGKFSTKCPKF